MILRSRIRIDKVGLDNEIIKFAIYSNFAKLKKNRLNCSFWE